MPMNARIANTAPWKMPPQPSAPTDGVNGFVELVSVRIIYSPSPKNTAVNVSATTITTRNSNPARPSDADVQISLTSVGMRATSRYDSTPTSATAGARIRTVSRTWRRRNRSDSAVTVAAAPKPSNASPITKYV